MPKTAYIIKQIWQQKWLSPAASWTNLPQIPFSFSRNTQVGNWLHLKISKIGHFSLNSKHHGKCQVYPTYFHYKLHENANVVNFVYHGKTRMVGFSSPVGKPENISERRQFLKRNTLNRLLYFSDRRDSFLRRRWSRYENGCDIYTRNSVSSGMIQWLLRQKILRVRYFGF